MKLKIADDVEPKGMIRIKTYKAGTIARAMPFVQKYNEAKKVGSTGQMRRLLAKIDSIFAESFVGMPVECPNLIMQGSLTGKDLFTQYLVGGTIYTGINYGGIGTSATAPAVSDTQLGAEVARTVVALATDSAFNVAQIRFFIADGSLANGTYNEFGMFMNASGTLNSGNIFNHALISPAYVKTAGLDTTVECDITLT